MTILQTKHQILLKLVSTIDQLENFLVTLHPKSLKQNKDRYQLSKTTRSDVHPPIFDQHLTHCFGIDCIGDHACYDCV